ncbi:hypothetical protein ACFXDH_33825 [Streptomyces sp. NPDC059467]|uniref:hypothetical protein n=1 Tax=Streptomyces sp. NPDC059467 TaxID=3346844 RepID=UPI00367899FF
MPQKRFQYEVSDSLPAFSRNVVVSQALSDAVWMVLCTSKRTFWLVEVHEPALSVGDLVPIVAFEDDWFAQSVFELIALAPVLLTRASCTSRALEL